MSTYGSEARPREYPRKEPMIAARGSQPREGGTLGEWHREEGSQPPVPLLITAN